MGLLRLKEARPGRPKLRPRQKGHPLASWPGDRQDQAARKTGSVETSRKIEIATGYGPAMADLDQPGTGKPGTGKPGAYNKAAGDQAGPGQSGGPAFLLVLTHGAGGAVDSPDLLAARQAAIQAGGAVARVVQPYRVRGARAPGSAHRQDAAWLEVIAALRIEFPGIPLVQGGRSNGARVACRTAPSVGARGVLALAFPLHPPGRPERSRADELRSAGTDVLVISGSRDPFGIRDPADAAGAESTGAESTGGDATGADATGGDATKPHTTKPHTTKVVVLAGETHALAGSPGRIADEVGAWLRELLGLPRG
jgi:predicted alpha/beta-hydrolase family hydrolase